jgi:leucyl-tRNA synthetase
MISKYGSDCTRMYTLYKASPSDDLYWDEKGIVGMQRWLTKVFKLVDKITLPKDSTQIPPQNPSDTSIPSIPPKSAVRPKKAKKGFVESEENESLYTTIHSTIQSVRVLIYSDYLY